MRIYKIFMKLMSKHLVFHLLIPLGLGVAVETFIAWRDKPDTNPLSNLGDFAHGGSYLAILVTFLFSAGWLIQKEARPPWDNILTETLDEVLSDATDIFATCTIALEDWFHPYTQQYLSSLVKHRIYPNAVRQKRVLLFKHEGEMAKAREQYLDGQYAKPLADIHRNYGIPLGFLRPEEINEMLQDFDVTGEAISWKRFKARNKERSDTGQHGNITTLDFAVIRHATGSVTVITFDKSGDIYRLVPIHDQNLVKPYEGLRDKIEAKVFNQKGATPQHNFSAFCGACGSATLTLPAAPAAVNKPSTSPDGAHRVTV